MKSYRFALIFLALSAILFSVSALIGAYINSKGMLVEPDFFCIPLGYISLAIGLLFVIYGFIKQNTRSK